MDKGHSTFEFPLQDTLVPPGVRKESPGREKLDPHAALPANGPVRAPVPFTFR
ncbi:MAG: hypothetical protein ACE5OP_03885 [Candidatus Glassbacteria bacterium]